MIKHRVLASSASVVMFFYYIICGIVTMIFPDFSLKMYALSFHGIRITNLQASVLSFTELFMGAIIYSAIVWTLVCSVGWVYEKLTKTK